MSTSKGEIKRKREMYRRKDNYDSISTDLTNEQKSQSYKHDPMAWVGGDCNGPIAVAKQKRDYVRHGSIQSNNKEDSVFGAFKRVTV